jgi:sugar phosphate isomerase/epimerase
MFYLVASMIKFSSIILKFDKQGEKTGWTYIEITAAIADKLNPGYKKSFRVKGKMDDYNFDQVALIPMGEGHFIMPLKVSIRKAIGKRKGAIVEVQMAFDNKEYELNTELMECLADEPEALHFFTSKPKSHQHYYSKWVESAKTDATKAKRIAMAVSSLAKKIEFGEMLRNQRDLHQG